MSEVITEKDARYALNIVAKICAEVGPGSPGSPQERERAFLIKRELETHLGAENVAVEEFTLAPWAWLGSFPVGAIFTLAAALLNILVGSFPGRFSGFVYIVTAAIGLAFSILALLMLVFEYIRRCGWRKALPGDGGKHCRGGTTRRRPLRGEAQPYGRGWERCRVLQPGWSQSCLAAVNENTTAARCVLSSKARYARYFKHRSAAKCVEGHP